MDKSNFNTIVEGLRGTETERNIALESILKLVRSHELRDYDWSGLYSAVLYAQTNHILIAGNSNHGTKQASLVEIEAQLWELWLFLVESPAEFNNSTASQAPEVTTELAVLLLDRIVFIATRGGGAYGEEVVGQQAFCLRGCQFCVHWLYSARPDLRASVRKALIQRLSLTTGADMGAYTMKGFRVAGGGPLWGYDGGSLNDLK